MLPWLGLSIDDVASVMNLTLVYGIGNIILVLAAPTPHCCYATPKAHQYFPLPPPDAPIFIPDIETL